jgi:hypothetical protein
MQTAPANQNASRPYIKAVIYGARVSEVEQHAHENIAKLTADFISAVRAEWIGAVGSVGVLIQDESLMVASVADVLSDCLEGLSSGHLQALRAVR